MCWLCMTVTERGGKEKRARLQQSSSHCRVLKILCYVSYSKNHYLHLGFIKTCSCSYELSSSYCQTPPALCYHPGNPSVLLCAFLYAEVQQLGPLRIQGALRYFSSLLSTAARFHQTAPTLSLTAEKTSKLPRGSLSKGTSI